MDGNLKHAWSFVVDVFKQMFYISVDVKQLKTYL